MRGAVSEFRQLVEPDGSHFYTCVSSICVNVSEAVVADAFGLDETHDARLLGNRFGTNGYLAKPVQLHIALQARPNTRARLESVHRPRTTHGCGSNDRIVSNIGANVDEHVAWRQVLAYQLTHRELVHAKSRDWHADHVGGNDLQHEPLGCDGRDERSLGPCWIYAGVHPGFETPPKRAADVCPKFWFCGRQVVRDELLEGEHRRRG